MSGCMVAKVNTSSSALSRTLPLSLLIFRTCLLLSLTHSHLFSLLYGIDEFGESLPCTRLLADFLTLSFYEVFPRHLTLLVLSSLDPMDLTRCLLLSSCCLSLLSSCRPSLFPAYHSVLSSDFNQLWSGL